MFQKFQLNNFEKSAKLLKELINKNKDILKNILKIEDKNYNNFIVPYQEMLERLGEFTTPIFHIDSVKNSELTQRIYNECLPIISIYNSQLSSNEDIFNAFKEIKEKDFNNLNNEQQKVIDNELRDFKLGGCGLSNENKNELEKINLELSEIGKQFSQNLLDATNNWEMILEDFEDVKEISKNDLETAKFIDKEDGKTKYKFTLQIPSYMSYITYGTNREKREEIYKAFTTKAPENGKLIEKILILRDKEAKLLEFENYAQLSLASKMAKDEDSVLNFLYELGKYSQDKAKDELLEVSELAKEDNITKIESYDLAYYSEKLKKKKYDIDEEYYRPYFEKNIVVEGLLTFLNDIFGIKFTKLNEKSWDDDVMVYQVEENNKIIAKVFIDLEVREDKKGGAWMNNWHTHSIIDGKENLATAYIVCNFPASSGDRPSLLRHSDVVTLFHEMGHTLHHILSKVDEPFVSGINGVSWDTVEFPSQFLEYFAYDKKVLQLFAKHYKTDKILDDEAIDKLIKAKNFQSSLTTIRQLEFALFDFTLHQKLYDENGVQTLLDSIREKISPLKPPSYNKFQNGFSHIFAGGYAAGYYSYKWAEVLSADAFYMFIDNPTNHKELAKQYKNIILALGGSKNMNDLFFQFTNREADIKSLLKIEGIIS